MRAYVGLLQADYWLFSALKAVDETQMDGGDSLIAIRGSVIRFLDQIQDRAYEGWDRAQLAKFAARGRRQTLNGKHVQKLAALDASQQKGRTRL
jgi:hypothetical protein